MRLSVHCQSPELQQPAGRQVGASGPHAHLRRGPSPSIPSGAHTKAVELVETAIEETLGYCAPAPRRAGHGRYPQAGRIFVTGASAFSRKRRPVSQPFPANLARREGLKLNGRDQHDWPQSSDRNRQHAARAVAVTSQNAPQISTTTTVAP